jgi:carbonic anhydrase
VTIDVDIAANDALTHERASVLDRDIRRVCQEIRKVWIYLAGDLYEFHQDRCWELLGHDSFEAWLADPEIDMHPRHVYRMIQAWRELVVERGVTPASLEHVDVTKVSVVLPAIRAEKASAEDALADATMLSRSDLHDRYAGDLSTPIAPENEDWHDCPDCGRSHKAKRA